jgi:hypothetical protein
MKNTQHTPGKWVACPPDDSSPYWEIEDEYGHTATVYGEDIPCSWAEANARLIAAAPELLDALKEIVRIGETEAFDVQARDNMTNWARAALAKLNN